MNNLCASLKLQIKREFADFVLCKAPNIIHAPPPPSPFPCQKKPEISHQFVTFLVVVSWGQQELLSDPPM